MLAHKPILVQGQPLTKLPEDLFIPPDALEVLLDSFAGPLDLLLYLIKRDNLNILDIPIAHISRQYLHYIDLMEVQRQELAAEYLLMAAMLAEIKSRLLLPLSPNAEEALEEDPRAELVRKLQAYEQFKQAALELDQLPRAEREHFRVSLTSPPLNAVLPQPEVELDSLLQAMLGLLQEKGLQVHHQIKKETLSVRERMAYILQFLADNKYANFNQLIKRQEGRLSVVVSLLAILELAKEALILIRQSADFSLISIQVNKHE